MLFKRFQPIRDLEAMLLARNDSSENVGVVQDLSVGTTRHVRRQRICMGDSID